MCSRRNGESRGEAEVKNEGEIKGQTPNSEVQEFGVCPFISPIGLAGPESRSRLRRLCPIPTAILPVMGAGQLDTDRQAVPAERVWQGHCRKVRERPWAVHHGVAG